MSLKIDAGAAGTVTLGGDLTVNRMGFGGMRLCGPGVWGWPADRENALDVLRRAVALGVSFIDTADAYGPHVNEEQIAAALYPYPTGLVIATKVGVTREGPGKWEANGEPRRLRECAHDALRRLRVECIDVLQLHAVDEHYPLAEQVGVLHDLRSEGKVRHVGVSNVTLEQLMEARGIVEIVSVQNPYNAGNDHGNDALVDYCQREGIAFLPYFPLDAGDIGENETLRAISAETGASVFQAALVWLLRRSATMLPIPGTQSIAHLEENIAAAGM